MENTLKPFFDAMRQLGWVERQTIAHDRVCADDQQQALPRLASGLVAQRRALGIPKPRSIVLRTDEVIQ